MNKMRLFFSGKWQRNDLISYFEEKKERERDNKMVLGCLNLDFMSSLLNELKTETDLKYVYVTKH